MKIDKIKNIKQEYDTLFRKNVTFAMKILLSTKKTKKFKKSVDFVNTLWYYKEVPSSR